MVLGDDFFDSLQISLLQLLVVPEHELLALVLLLLLLLGTETTTRPVGVQMTESLDIDAEAELAWNRDNLGLRVQIEEVLHQAFVVDFRVLLALPLVAFVATSADERHSVVHQSLGFQFPK